MIMAAADAVISRFRRDLLLGTILRSALALAAVAALWAGPIAGFHFNTTIVLSAIVVVWVVSFYRSLKESRLARDASSLIATGQFDAAEQQIDSALRRFSLFRPSKLIGLHHLALLRHAQRRWPETAALCRALLAQRLGPMRGLSRTARLLLSHASLETGDINGAATAIAGLYTERLPLSETLTLQLLQLDFLARQGAWEGMLAQIGTRIALSELMPAAKAARSQAFLAMAADQCGRADLSVWLRKRAALLADRNEIVEDHAHGERCVLLCFDISG